MRRQSQPDTLPSAVVFRREKEVIQSVEAQLKEISQIFKEQTRCLDERATAQTAILDFAGEFLRKWSELEAEHGQRLERLVRSFSSREKAAASFSYVSMSVGLVGLYSACSKISKMHQQLADTISGPLVAERFQPAREESQIIRKQCQSVIGSTHEAIKKAGQDVIATVKPYNQECRALANADTQYREALADFAKAGGTLPKGKGAVNTPPSDGKPHTLQKSSSFKKQQTAEKKLLEKQDKRNKCLLMSSTARNEHLLAISGISAAISCYNIDILPRYIKAMDVAARPALCSALASLSTALDSYQQQARSAGEELTSAVVRCRAENDIALLASYASGVFGAQQQQQPTCFVFRFAPLHSDLASTEMSNPGELVPNSGVLEKRVALTNVNSETRKNLAALIKFMDDFEEARWPQISTPNMATPNKSSPRSSMPAIDVYAQTLRQFADVDVQYFKNEHELTLIESAISSGASSTGSSLSSPKAARQSSGNPASSDSSENMEQSANGNRNRRPSSRTPVFGGSLEDHLNQVGLNDSTQSNNQANRSISSNMSNIATQRLPHIVSSCVAYLAKYGLSQQGVFRINGSAVEIAELKAAFARHENPLAELNSGISVNVAASVLKTYFRHLQEPLLLGNGLTFDDWLRLTSSPNISEVQKLVDRLSGPVRLVAGFLFAFLNRVHLNSGNNMMDAHNLAVCFAPCVLPAPTENDYMKHFTPLANIVKCLVLNYEAIFGEEVTRMYADVVGDAQLSAATPEKRPMTITISKAAEDQPVPTKAATAPMRNLSENLDMSPIRAALSPMSNISTGFEECEALFNFSGRNIHELSVQRGDRMRVVRKWSEQWWEVAANGRTGLVPASYLKIIGTPAPTPVSNGNGASHNPAVKSLLLGEKSHSAASPQQNGFSVMPSAGRPISGISQPPEAGSSSAIWLRRSVAISGCTTEFPSQNGHGDIKVMVPMNSGVSASSSSADADADLTATATASDISEESS